MNKITPSVVSLVNGYLAPYGPLDNPMEPSYPHDFELKVLESLKDKGFGTLVLLNLAPAQLENPDQLKPIQKHDHALAIGAAELGYKVVPLNLTHAQYREALHALGGSARVQEALGLMQAELVAEEAAAAKVVTVSDTPAVGESFRENLQKKGISPSFFGLPDHRDVYDYYTPDQNLYPFLKFVFSAGGVAEALDRPEEPAEEPAFAPRHSGVLAALGDAVRGWRHGSKEKSATREIGGK